MMNGVDTSSGNWPSIDVVKVQGAQALAGAFVNGAYVPMGMSSISYLPIRYVDGLQMQTVGITITTRDEAIFPVADSITRGFYERSMDYPIPS